MIERAAKVTYPPVGFCIYCRKKNVDLTREHILADGFGGNYVLPKSSCSDCQKITRDLEAIVLREMFGGYRIKVDMPTGHPQDRPNILTIPIRTKDGRNGIVTIDAKSNPGVMAFPIYAYPGVLSRDPPIDDWDWGIHLVFPDPVAYQELLQKTAGAPPLILADAAVFARVLAKIAHATACAERVAIRDPYKLLLPDLILGNSNAATHVVGCLFTEIPDPDLGVPHKITLGRMIVNGYEYLYADIRLFAYLPTPIYRVVFSESPIDQTPEI